MVKNPPAMQETWVQSLSQEDPMEKGMATRSSILALRTPWTGEPQELQSTGSQRAGHGLVIDMSQDFPLCLYCPSAHACCLRYPLQPLAY